MAIGDRPGGDLEGAAVDVDAHDVAAAGEDHERYERERDAEGEHDLAEDEHVGGVQCRSRGRSSAGIIVIARRSASGMWKLMKPAITTWPA